MDDKVATNTDNQVSLTNQKYVYNGNMKSGSVIGPSKTDFGYEENSHALLVYSLFFKSSSKSKCIVTGGHVMHVGRGTLNHGLPFIYPMNSDKNVQVPCVLLVQALALLNCFWI